MIKGKKVVIFDMDGTLIDSVGVWNEVDHKLISKLGEKKAEKEDIQFQRDTILRKVSRESNPYLEYCNYLKEEYGSNITGKEVLHLRYQIANDYLKNVIDYKKDAEVLIKELRDCGMILVIATTTKKSNMDIYRNMNRNIIKKASLDDFFSIIYTREDATEIKPNPEIYYRIMKELNVTPADCIIFEDSLIGIEAANSAGIEVIAMYDRYSNHEREEINKNANFKFDDYASVLDAINKEFSMVMK